MAKLLLVEDDSSLLFMIRTCLETDRHLVDTVERGDEAIALIKLHEYDLLILDWNLPDISGLDICARFRGQGGVAPVLMLTAKSTSEDKVQALDCGADDYITKPFDPPELLARVRALLRRPRNVLDGTISLGGIDLNPEILEVRVNGTITELSVKECALLTFLMKHPRQSFTTEAIAHRLWPSDTDISNDTVRSHIKNLRKKLQDADGLIIRQTRGLGYCFNPTKTEVDI